MRTLRSVQLRAPVLLRIAIVPGQALAGFRTSMVKRTMHFYAALPLTLSLLFFLVLLVQDRGKWWIRRPVTTIYLFRPRLVCIAKLLPIRPRRNKMGTCGHSHYQW